MKMRNLPDFKLRLFSSLKRKTTIGDEPDNYNWKQEAPYDINQAFEVLDNVNESDQDKNSQEHMALLKAFKKKLSDANLHFS